MDSPSQPIACALCGALNAATLTPEVDVTHSPDMDLRPAGRARRTLAAWVQCCSACGYAQPALDALPEGLTLDAARALVASEKYTVTLSDVRYPALANGFRALALLQAAANEPAAADLAALSLLYAAWTCDDAADADDSAVAPVQAQALARGLRRTSAERLRAALEEGRAPVVDSATSWLVLADCYRRAEAYPSAHTATVRGLAAVGDGEDSASAVLRGLLHFEQQLAEAQETAAVNMAQAFEPDA